MSGSNHEISHREAVASRFDTYFSHLQDFDSDFSVSRLARLLGYSDARKLDQLREGIEYSPFKVLDDFAERAALDPDWFKDGVGNPFARNRCCYVNINSLLSELLKNGEWQNLYAVRSSDPEGRVCLVRVDNDYVWCVFPTPLYLSKTAESAGASNLLAFYRLLKQIDAMQVPFPTSATLRESSFDSLISGETFPGSILQNQINCEWAEDFVDIGMKSDWKETHLSLHGPQFMDAVAIVRNLLSKTA